MSSATPLPAAFPALFSPLRIGGVTLRNRIMSTGHDTVLPTDSVVNEALVAYQQARARGGVGLIVLQVSGVHETARYTSHALMATDDSCIAGYRALADAVHAHGTVVFGQLFHPGREIMESADGLLTVAYAPSVSPNERFHVMPRALSIDLINDIVKGYGAAARRMFVAGMDGVEVVASHGYLPAQFLNPKVNRREDEYGKDEAGRLLFLQQVLAEIRRVTSAEFVIGLRISGDEKGPGGLTESDALAASSALENQLDYVNVIAGTSATLGGAVHIVPPMNIPNAYLAPLAARFKARLSIPVFVAGRINQPHEAEAILTAGQADVCGMTRALICDPEMPDKAQQGRTDDIRACIACNQACIGRFHRGLPISCIQHPGSGRELLFKKPAAVTRPKKIMVVGAGPAGMKAAATAAQRGHDVSLFEASGRLGGQANLAQLLPGRAEFGGIITNLQREMQLAGVKVHLNQFITRTQVDEFAPDSIIIATGAQPRMPPIEGDAGLQIVNAWQILQKEVKAGSSVLVADWRCDWIGPGIALHLAQQGSHVKLAVTGTHMGETMPQYVRDDTAGQLHIAGIEVIPYARLYGVDDRSVYMQHVASGAAMIFENIDTLVLCQGHEPVDTLRNALGESIPEIVAIGDCQTARTAEEAIYEGFAAGWAI